MPRRQVIQRLTKITQPTQTAEAAQAERGGANICWRGRNRIRRRRRRGRCRAAAWGRRGGGSAGRGAPGRLLDDEVHRHAVLDVVGAQGLGVLHDLAGENEA